MTATCSAHTAAAANTPADLHYGLAPATAQRRSQAVAAARAPHPTRFATDHDHDTKTFDLPLVT